MPIIVSQNGKNATKLDKLSFGLENKLQAYIYDNPESIPLYDIKDDIQLLILAREFGTNSGPIDAVGIDRDGELYLVETKLYKNPDKRTVVAQVLDYGASLWKSQSDFDDFLLQLNGHVQKQFGQSVGDKVKDFYGLDDEALQIVFERMKYNLNEGNFKFVVLMDNLHDQLKDLILYMNQNSKFDIYGVELEYYQHDSFEIMIPRLFGAEVKKDVKVSRGVETSYSEDDFKHMFAQAGYASLITEILNFATEISSGKTGISGLRVHKSANYLNFRYFFPNSSKQALSISIGIRNGKPLSQMDFWCDNAEYQEYLIEPVSKCVGKTVQRINTKSGVGMLTRLELDKVSVSKLHDLFKTLSEIVV